MIFGAVAFLGNRENKPNAPAEDKLSNTEQIEINPAQVEQALLSDEVAQFYEKKLDSRFGCVYEYDGVTVINYSFGETEEYKKIQKTNTLKTPGDATDVRQFNSHERQLTKQLLEQYLPTVCNVRFVETSPEDAQISIFAANLSQYQVGDTKGANGVASYPLYALYANQPQRLVINSKIIPGTIFGNNYSPYYVEKKQNEFIGVVLHEIGHNLGLCHPFKMPSLDSYYHSETASVMNYPRSIEEEWGSAGTMYHFTGYALESQITTYQIADINALRYLYGAPEQPSEYKSHNITQSGFRGTVLNQKEDTLTISADFNGSIGYILLDARGGAVEHYSVVQPEFNNFYLQNTTQVWLYKDIRNISSPHDCKTTVIGNDLNNTISTAAGDDTIHSGYGDDTITTGEGRDIIVIYPDDGHDVITDYNPQLDVIEYKPPISNYRICDGNDNTIIEFLSENDEPLATLELRSYTGDIGDIRVSPFKNDTGVEGLRSALLQFKAGVTQEIHHLLGHDKAVVKITADQPAPAYMHFEYDGNISRIKLHDSDGSYLGGFDIRGFVLPAITIIREGADVIPIQIRGQLAEQALLQDGSVVYSGIDEHIFQDVSNCTDVVTKTLPGVILVGDKGGTISMKHEVMVANGQTASSEDVTQYEIYPTSKNTLMRCFIEKICSNKVSLDLNTIFPVPAEDRFLYATKLDDEKTAIILRTRSDCEDYTNSITIIHENCVDIAELKIYVNGKQTQAEQIPLQNFPATVQQEIMLAAEEGESKRQAVELNYALQALRGQNYAIDVEDSVPQCQLTDLSSLQTHYTTRNISGMSR